jgi:hypothetical protein
VALVDEPDTIDEALGRLGDVLDGGPNPRDEGVAHGRVDR